MAEAPERCSFEFDPEAWEREHDGECFVDPDSDYDEEILTENADGNKVWRCPHEAVEGENECMFHLPRDSNVKPAADTVADGFLELANGEREVLDGDGLPRFIGAEFESLNLDTERIGDGRSVDIRHAEIGSAECAVDAVDSAPLDARGINVRGVWESEDVAFSGDARFDGATFGGDARFDGAVFHREARFTGAEFDARGGFNRVVFRRTAWFDRVGFDGTAGFSGAEFGADAWFGGTERTPYHDRTEYGGAKFGADAWFNGAEFIRHAGFDRASFGERAGFNRVTFGSSVGFVDVGFTADAGFRRAEFNGSAGFTRTEFGGTVWFDRADFDGTGWFKETVFRETARFDRTEFESGVNFTDAEFNDEAKFNGAEFDTDHNTKTPTLTVEAEFSRVTFGANAEFSRVTFGANAEFDGAEFEQEASFIATGWYPVSPFQSDADFSDVTARDSLRFVDEYGVDSPGKPYTFLGEVDFSGAEVPDVEFNGVALLGRGTFENADLVRADLSGSSFDGATFEDADLVRADLSGSSFDGATFENADLTQADLSESSYKGATFEGADLVRVDFAAASVARADFDDAELSRASLYGTDLTDARLYGARMEGAHISDHTDFGIRDLPGRRRSSLVPFRGPWPGIRYDPRNPEYEALADGEDRGAEDGENISDYTRAAAVYAEIGRIAEANADSELASRCYLWRKDMQRRRYWSDEGRGNSRERTRWLRSMVANVFVRYGESPWRVTGSAGLIILGCALLYYVLDLIEYSTSPSQSALLSAVGGTPPSSVVTFLDAVYFSTLTFSTLGMGTFQPSGPVGRAVAIFETLSGVVLLALLVFVFGRRATR